MVASSEQSFSSAPAKRLLNVRMATPSWLPAAADPGQPPSTGATSTCPTCPTCRSRHLQRCRRREPAADVTPSHLQPHGPEDETTDRPAPQRAQPVGRVDTGECRRGVGAFCGSRQVMCGSVVARDVFHRLLERPPFKFIQARSFTAFSKHRRSSRSAHRLPNSHCVSNGKQDSQFCPKSIKRA